MMKSFVEEQRVDSEIGNSDSTRPAELDERQMTYLERRLRRALDELARLRIDRAPEQPRTGDEPIWPEDLNEEQAPKDLHQRVLVCMKHRFAAVARQIVRAFGLGKFPTSDEPDLPLRAGWPRAQRMPLAMPATATPQQAMKELKAFVLTLLWGGRCGARPAFVFTGHDDRDASRGRGIGKSTIPELMSGLVGGLVEVSPQSDIEAIKRRLLSPDAKNLRMARIDNLKTHRFSWGDLEGLITAPIISGHRLYRGEGRRPNTLTWAITLNGASLSTDMAQRSVIIHVQRPAYSENWEASTRQFIETNRWQINSDAISEIRRTLL
jgi:hypothetical protein